jgi:hypothetical protein
MRSFINLLFAKYNYNYKVKEDGIGRACSMNGEKRNAYRTLGKVRRKEISGKTKT